MPRLTFARAVQIFQLLRQGATLLIMVALAQAGLSLADIGNYESLRYIGYALTAFWVGGLSNAYLRVSQSTEHPERWFTFYLLVVCLLGLVMFAAFALGLVPIGGLLVANTELSFGLAFGTFLLGQLIGNVVEQEAIVEQASARLLYFAVSSYGLQIVCFVGPLMLGYPMYLAMWGLAASAVYRVGWALVRYLMKSDASPPIASELRIFWQAASGLSVYGLTAIGVVLVDHALVAYSSEVPAEAIALWRYGAQEMPLLLGIVAGLNSTALVEGRLGIVEMMTQLRRRTRRVGRVFLPLSILLMVSSFWWYPRLLSPEFYGAHVVFNTMLLLVPSRLIQTTPLLVSRDLTSVMTYTGIAENAFNVVASVILHQYFGLLGIALGTVLAFSLERIVYVTVLDRQGYALTDYLPTGEWVLGTLALLGAYFLCTDFGALG